MSILRQVRHGNTVTEWPVVNDGSLIFDPPPIVVCLLWKSEVCGQSSLKLCFTQSIISTRNVFLNFSIASGTIRASSIENNYARSCSKSTQMQGMRYCWKFCPQNERASRVGYLSPDRHWMLQSQSTCLSSVWLCQQWQQFPKTVGRVECSALDTNCNCNCN